MKLKEIYDKAMKIGKALMIGTYDYEKVNIEEDGSICVTFTRFFGRELDEDYVCISEIELNNLSSEEIIAIRKKEEYDIRLAEELRKKEIEEQRLKEQEERDLKLYVQLKERFDNKNKID